MFKNLVSLFNYRQLIQSMVARELKARYRGSVLGFFWSFITRSCCSWSTRSSSGTSARPAAQPGPVRAVPLLRHPAMDLVLLVYPGILERPHRRRQPDQEGALPGRGAPDRQRAGEHGALLPGVADSLVFLIYYRAPLQISELVWFPVVVLVQLLLTLGLSLIVSALTVHFRDLKDICRTWSRSGSLRPDHLLDAGRATHREMFLDMTRSRPGRVVPGDPVLPGQLRALEVARRPRRGFAGAVLAGYYLFNRLRDTFAEEYEKEQ